MSCCTHRSYRAFPPYEYACESVKYMQIGTFDRRHYNSMVVRQSGSAYGSSNSCCMQTIGRTRNRSAVGLRNVSAYVPSDRVNTYTSSDKRYTGAACRQCAFWYEALARMTRQRIYCTWDTNTVFHRNAFACELSEDAGGKMNAGIHRS